MKQYQELLQAVLTNGQDAADDSGRPLKRIFGAQARFNLAEGFPLVTTKSVNFRTVVAELIWTLSGDTSVKKLNEMGVSAWNSLADAKGELGTTTGSLWRNSASMYRTAKHTDTFTKGGHDQIAEIKHHIINGTNQTTLIVTAWDPSETNRMPQPSLVPLLQFFVEGDKLSLLVHQRSGDLGVGVPYSIAENALLLSMMAQSTGKQADQLIVNFGHLYLYESHLKRAEEMVKMEAPALPTLQLSPDVKLLSDFAPDNIGLENYNPIIVKKVTEPELVAAG